MEPILSKFKEYQDSKYVVLRMLNQKDPMYTIEEKRDLEDYTSRLARHVWAFKENYSRKAKSFSGDIFSNALSARYFLERTFPYCFEIDGSIGIDNLDDALKFYALSKGASEEQLSEIIPLLQSIKMNEIGDEYNEVLPDTELVTSYFPFEDVVGSALVHYQASNLYDTLIKMDDKQIASFIDYIVINSSNVFDGVACYRDANKDYYVVEGNHRLMVKRALNVIDAYLGKTPLVTYPLKAEVQRVKGLM